MNKRPPDYAKALAAIIGGYVLVFCWLAVRRFEVFGWDSGDIGNFNDMFWWTLHGRPFYFPGRGYSNFGLHAAFLWAQLLPIYAVLPGPKTLLFLQSLALGLAAWPMYLIARRVLDNHVSALVVAGAYLLFPPIVSQNVNQVEEPSFIPVYLLFAFYFFTGERFGLFMLFAFIACLGRENVPLAVAMFGVCAAILRRPKRWVLAPLAMGMVYFVVVTFFVMPKFRPGIAWDPTAHMFSYLGNTPQAIMQRALTEPGLVSRHILDGENISYFVMLVQPLGWVLPFTSLASLMALPDLAINLISDNGALKVIPWHYNVLTGTFLFVGVLYALRRLARWLGQRDSMVAAQTRLLGVALFLMVVAHWYLWFTPSQYERLPYHEALVRAIDAVPRDKSVLVPPHLQGHVSGREHWQITNMFVERPEYAAQFEYVILDANDRRFAPVVTPDFFARFYKNPRYQLIFSEKGVFVFRRTGQASP
jgi:uncharacterized membrane protein